MAVTWPQFTVFQSITSDYMGYSEAAFPRHNPPEEDSPTYLGLSRNRTFQCLNVLLQCSRALLTTPENQVTDEALHRLKSE